MTVAANGISGAYGGHGARTGPRRTVEDSIPLRVAVLVAVLASVFAVFFQGIGTDLLRVAAPVGITAGFWYSHVARHRNQMALKVFLAVALCVVALPFFSSLSGVTAPGALQAPLAELFLWVQVLHSLDVPARRDLLFSLLSSLVLGAVAAVSAVSVVPAPFLLVWVVAAVAALMLAHGSELRERPQLSGVASVRGGPGLGALLGPVVAVLLAVAVVATAVFLVVPAAGPGRPVTFPASLPPSATPLGTPGALSNPSLGPADPAAGGDMSPDALSGRASFGYFGFAESLDTGLRGRPDNTLVMRVRASRPDFWRGQTFDTFDGRRWTQSDEEVFEVAGAPLDLHTPPELVDVWRSEELVQTVHMEVSGPNLIFAANHASRLYFADRRVFQLRDGSVRTGVRLDAGAVYTVVSRREPVTASRLRTLGGYPLDLRPELVARYTQLPDAVSPRVLDLAEQVAGDETSTYDAVLALERWMGENTEYTLDIPPLPAGGDAVDQFLFVDRRGFCEQIASSLVVMLRSLGIPARLAVGYTPGQRNPFTGMFEVKASDAHAWAEVWFPTVGWQAFDPTASVPLSGDTVSSSAGAGLFRYLGARLPRSASASLVAIGAVIAATAAVRTVRRRRGRPRPTWAEEMLAGLEAIGRGAGRERRPGESAVRYAAAIARTADGDPQLIAAAEAVERDAFSGQTLSDAERAAVEAVLVRSRAR